MIRNEWPPFHTEIQYERGPFISSHPVLQGISGQVGRNLTVISDRKHSMGVRNVTCACSLGYEICVFTFRMNFELRGWPPQPPTFSSNSTKIAKTAQF